MPIWNERILLVLYVDYSQIPKWIDDMIIVSWKYEIRNDICLAKKRTCYRKQSKQFQNRNVSLENDDNITKLDTLFSLCSNFYGMFF